MEGTPIQFNADEAQKLHQEMIDREVAGSDRRKTSALGMYDRQSGMSAKAYLMTSVYPVDQVVVGANPNLQMINNVQTSGPDN